MNILIYCLKALKISKYTRKSASPFSIKCFTKSQQVIKTDYNWSILISAKKMNRNHVITMAWTVNNSRYELKLTFKPLQKLT